MNLYSTFLMKSPPAGAGGEPFTYLALQYIPMGLLIIFNVDTH